MDIRFERHGVTFVWNAEKAQANVVKHAGIGFEQAVEVFFDPFLRIVDAGRNDEARDAAIGYDAQGRLLFVVHIQFESDDEGESIRIISARRATREERDIYDF
jgi:uncharacterized DUF497 family protein